MQVGFKEFDSVVLEMIFTGLAILVWMSTYYLADYFHCSKKVFDILGIVLIFCGFASCLIMEENDDEKDRGN